jgi:hypothetical protein
MDKGSARDYSPGQAGMSVLESRGEERVKRILIGSAALLVALATSAVALAGSSSLLGQYAGAGGQAQKEVPLSARAALHTGGNLGGNLPFTGLDLAWIVAGGIVLVLTGLLIYRAGRVKA